MLDSVMKGMVGRKSDDVIIKLDDPEDLDERVADMNEALAYRTQRLKDPKTHAILKLSNDRCDDHILWSDFTITDAFVAGAKYQREKDST